MRINLLFRLNRWRQNGPPDRALSLRIFARLTRSRLRRGVLRSANAPWGRHRQLHRAPHPNRYKTLHPAR
jgi:hypothetical protein